MDNYWVHYMWAMQRQKELASRLDREYSWRRQVSSDRKSFPQVARWLTQLLAMVWGNLRITGSRIQAPLSGWPQRN